MLVAGIGQLKLQRGTGIERCRYYEKMIKTKITSISGTKSMWLVFETLIPYTHLINPW